LGGGGVLLERKKISPSSAGKESVVRRRGKNTWIQPGEFGGGESSLCIAGGRVNFKLSRKT